MAFQTATAASCTALYDALIDFLLNDPELTGLSQNWEIAWEPDSNSGSEYENATDIVLVGPGLSATDQVYIGLRLETNIPDDSATVYIVGMTGVIPSALAYDQHVNVSTAPVRMFLRGNNAMNYWFAANGRRFVAVAQVSTVYEACYAGLFHPYADPTQYSYPLFIGGSAGADGGSTEPVDWRSTLDGHTIFHRPHYATGASGHNPSSWMLSPQREWLRCGVNNAGSQNVGVGPAYFFTGNIAVAQSFGLTSYGYDSVKDRIGATFDDEFILTPLTLVQQTPGDQTYGVLDGVYHVPGRGNSAENVVQADSIDHVCFNNVFRTSTGEMFAVAMGTLTDSNS